MRSLSLVLVPFALASCASYGSPEWVSDKGSYPLAEIRDEAGRATVDLDYRGYSEATLVVRRQIEENVVQLGLDLTELPRKKAEDLELRPFCGMYVAGVGKDSEAARLGLREGDILVSAAGKPVYHDSHVEDLKRSLVGQRTVVITVWPSGDSDNPTDFELAIESKSSTREERQLVRLESGGANRPYAGIYGRGIPMEWGEKLYSEGRTGVVITGTVLGSPAWLAGIRAGDIVTHLDDEAVQGMAWLTQSIQDAGLRGDSLVFHVERDGKPFAADVDLEDYSGRASASFPLLFRTSSTVSRDEFRLGPFGWLLDFDSRYLPSKTRQPESSTEFSMLFGLFKVESSPSWSGVRLLWFLRIGSS